MQAEDKADRERMIGLRASIVNWVSFSLLPSRLREGGHRWRPKWNHTITPKLRSWKSGWFISQHPPS